MKKIMEMLQNMKAKNEKKDNKGYSRHPGSLYRIYRKLGYSSYAPSTKKKRN